MRYNNTFEVVVGSNIRPLVSNTIACPGYPNVVGAAVSPCHCCFSMIITCCTGTIDAMLVASWMLCSMLHLISLPLELKVNKANAPCRTMKAYRVFIHNRSCYHDISI